MSLSAKVTYEDLMLYEIMRNPVLFVEFVNNFDKLPTDEEFELTWYQKEFMLDFNNYVSIMAGRASGKTLSLTNLLLWLLVFKVFPEDYIIYTVPSKVHLEPVFTGLTRMLRTNSFLKEFINSSDGINRSDFTIKLKNQSVLMCRIAGQSGTGNNVIGLHTPFVIVDESGYYNYSTFTELQPIVNTFTSGYKLIVAGVPDGRREKSVCYHCDMENSSYSKHRISSDFNPRLTPADRLRAIEQFGGEDTDDFIHMFLAQHGKPVFSLFDRGSFSIGDDPVYQLALNGLEIGESISDYVRKMSAFPGLTDRSHKCIMGIDLGYTEPTAIIIMYLDRMGRIHFHGRIKLTKVSYPIQERLIDYLDSRFDPLIIGIDKGSVGMSVIQRLTTSEEFDGKNYDKRIYPIDFSSNTVLGVDSEGNEIREKTKPFSVNILQEYSNDHKIIYSHTDLEMITELERMTYTKTPTGEIVYRTLTIRGGKKGEDHFTSALLCGVLAYYLTTDYLKSKSKKIKLFKPGWII